MLKIILSTVLSIFTATALLMVFYWRDLHFDPTAKDILIYFLWIPLGISCLVLMPYLAWKWYQHKKQKEEIVQNEAQNAVEANEPLPKTEVEQIELNIYSASLLSQLGSNEELVAKIAKGVAPDLDKDLIGHDGERLLSYRIDETYFEDVAEQHLDVLPLQVRMMNLITAHFKENRNIFSSIAKQLKESALFYDTQLAYQYKMHPAWIGEDYDASEDIEEPIAEKVQKLDQLNLLMLLPSTLQHSWNELATTEMCESYLDELGILSEQINIEYHYCSERSAYHKLVELCQSNTQDLSEISFILAVESEIDQDTLDGVMSVGADYIPSEFIGSCCISSASIVFENIPVLKQVFIQLEQKDLAQTLSTFHLTDLSQYEEDEPFVIIPDDMRTPKANKKVIKNFESTPIEIHHLIYTKFSLGSTEQLSKVFGFLAGLHIPHTLTGFFYSLDLPEVQVVIKPKPEDDHEHI